MNDAAPAEFSRPVDTARIGREAMVVDIAAEPAERAALAIRFGLLALDRLAAQVRLRHLPGGVVELSARLDADVVQACVVTLEPVASHIAEDFTLLYGETDPAKDLLIDADNDTLEPLDDEVVDIGEAVAQQLSLVLDPFPRAPAAAPSEGLAVRENPRQSPFAVLAAHAKRRSGPE